MVADLAMTAVKDEVQHEMLTQTELHPLVTRGAERLISYHKSGEPVVIKSWGTTENVFQEVTSGLMAYGYSRVIAEDMAEQLVNHALEHANVFKGRHQTNIIGVKLEVSETDPEAQFETGSIETHRIDGQSKSAEVAGSSGQEVRLTATGTATTSNRAEVGNIFASVRQWSLWLKFEAPDKQELKGIAQNMAMQAMSGMALGEIAPEEMQQILQRLETLGQEGLLPSEMLSILHSMQEMSVLAQQTPSPETQAHLQILSDKISESLITGIEEGSLPADMGKMIIQSLSDFAQTYNLSEVMTPETLKTMETKIQIQEIKQQLGEMAHGLEGESRAVLEMLIEEMESKEGQMLFDHLDIIQQHLQGSDIPKELQAKVTGVIAAIQTLQIKIAIELGDAKATLAVIQHLGSIDFEALSPEQQEALKELRETLEILKSENPSIDQMKEALEGKGDPSIAKAVQTLIAELNKPAIQLALPQNSLNIVTQFITTHNEVVQKFIPQGGKEVPQPFIQAAETITHTPTEKVILTGKTFIPPHIAANENGVKTSDTPNKGHGGETPRTTVDKGKEPEEARSITPPDRTAPRQDTPRPAPISPPTLDAKLPPPVQPAQPVSSPNPPASPQGPKTPAPQNAPKANNDNGGANKASPSITLVPKTPTLAGDPKAEPVKSQTFTPDCCRPDYNKASGTKLSDQAKPVVSYQVETFKDGSLKIRGNGQEIIASADMVAKYGGPERIMDLADSIARGVPPETLKSKPIEDIFKAVDAEHRAAEIKLTTPASADTSVGVFENAELADIVRKAHQNSNSGKPIDGVSSSFTKAAKLPDDMFNPNNKPNSEQTVQTPKFRERRPSPKMAA